MDNSKTTNFPFSESSEIFVVFRLLFAQEEIEVNSKHFFPPALKYVVRMCFYYNIVND